MFDVLILDDEPLLCTMITDLLDDEGLTAASAYTANEALDVLRIPGARVLIADKHLGSEAPSDGFAFASEAMRLYPSLGVVHVSSDIAGLLRNRRSTPRERAVPKPFLPDELVEAVRDLLCVEPGEAETTSVTPS